MLCRHMYISILKHMCLLYLQAVVGMGEALVGNFPGRALSFTAPSGAGGQVRALPSACAAASVLGREMAVHTGPESTWTELMTAGDRHAWETEHTAAGAGGAHMATSMSAVPVCLGLGQYHALY